jgi:SAM-dependent methyltransferase
MLRKVAGLVLPRGVRQAIARSLLRWKQPTVAAGWDWYARNSRYGRGASGGPSGGGAVNERMGDQWSMPEVLGVNVPRGQFLRYLDEQMIGPYFGAGGSVLEIGAGGGRLTELLLTRCDRVIAADTGRTMIRLLRERFGDHPKIEYMLLDGHGLSAIPDASLDKVFSYDVFVHLQPWDVFNYLREIRRTLKPEGRAIIHHSNSFSELGWKKFVSDVPQNVGRHKTFDSFSVMTPQMMKDLAVRAGLEVMQQRLDLVPRDCVTFLRAPPCSDGMGSRSVQLIETMAPPRSVSAEARSSRG